jgi:peptidyl-prolyl cis-trans isomerase A (cyclophilin A)
MFGSRPTAAADTPAPPVDVSGEGVLTALLVTSMGEVTVELLEKDAPRTVANFVGLATGKVEWADPLTGQKTSRPLYDGTTFHRVIPDFMIQGGDPAGNGTGGPGFNWADEASALRIRHDRPGLLSMANRGPNTNGSQFFLTEVPTPWLDGKHAVFGRVTAGMDVVQRIARVPAAGGNNRPLTPVKLQEVRIYRA